MKGKKKWVHRFEYSESASVMILLYRCTKHACVKHKTIMKNNIHDLRLVQNTLHK